MGGSAQYEVIVIGGGASGLAAALSAARSGAKTAILERDVACGIKLLATGNGGAISPTALFRPSITRIPTSSLKS